MAYFAPYIDASGLHIPTYTDIRDDFINEAKSIFGNDIYLEPDSMDYQFISSVASKIYDSMLTNQLAYNSRGPATAIGTGLDIVVKINGMKRKSPTYSTCLVDLVGTPGAVILNGVAGDESGYDWDLPDSVTIGPGGTISVTATCQTSGPIAANPGSIINIVTPTQGWTSVNNSVAATVGLATETDSQLRARQSISTAQPSLTVLEGLKGAIAAIPDTTRLEVYENDTNAADSNGLPAHSITAVVEGGSDAEVAQAIFSKKSPGCYTNGTTTVNVTDNYGHVTPIRFYRPSYVDIDVTVNLVQQPGYTSQTTDDIKNYIAAYLNTIAIGDDLLVSSLWGIALQAMSNLAKPTFSITSITAGKHGMAQGTSPIATAFNEVLRGNVSYITVNVT
jgi:uncharacterized phage protein gp47/JayE